MKVAQSWTFSSGGRTPFWASREVTGSSPVGFATYWQRLGVLQIKTMRLLDCPTCWGSTWYRGGKDRRWQLSVDLVAMLWKRGINVKRINRSTHKTWRLPSIAGSSPAGTTTYLRKIRYKSESRAKIAQDSPVRHRLAVDSIWKVTRNRIGFDVWCAPENILRGFYNFELWMKYLLVRFAHIAVNQPNMWIAL